LNSVYDYMAFCRQGGSRAKAARKKRQLLRGDAPI
jgi:hypothetical protein